MRLGPSTKSSAPINQAFHIHNFQSVGRGRWRGERGGGGGERGYGGRKDERVTGEIVFTDDDSRCQTQTLHYECFADQARIEFEILPSKLTWKVAQTYL